MPTQSSASAVLAAASAPGPREERPTEKNTGERRSDERDGSMGSRTDWLRGKIGSLGAL